MKYLAATPAWIKQGTLLLAFLAGWSALCMGQSRAELEAERKKLLRDISRTSQELETTRNDKEAALRTFLALEKQIKQRQSLISTLEREISYTENSIQRTGTVLQALEEDIEQLRQEYSQMLRVALRQKMNQTYLVFLFSANNFNDAFRRWQYIRQYDRYRNRQARLISETQLALTAKAEQLAARKSEKIDLLASIQQQQASLNEELSDKDKLLDNLQSDEKRLVADLQRQEKEKEKLNSVIEKIIREEMLAKRRKARSAEALNNEAESGERSLETTASLQFQQSKGSLPWPVESGEVIRPFGVHFHPVYKEVKLTNNGIDIKTNARARVRTVFAGTVAGTQFIPGYKHTVIIQHGQFYTVYSNLDEIYIQRGDKVDAKQDIGRVSRDKPEVHFELWKEKERLDPADWVATGRQL